MYRFLPVLVAAIASGQTLVDLHTQTKNVDFTAASSTRPVKTGTTLPALCTVGDLFFNTAAPSGSNVYGCFATNSWAVQGGGGGGSPVIENNGVIAGSRGTVNFIAGAG